MFTGTGGGGVIERLRASRAAAEWPQPLADVRPTQRADELSTNGYVLDTLRIAVWALLADPGFEVPSPLP